MLLLLWGSRVAGRTCWPEPPCWTRGGGPRPPSAPRLVAASASGLSWGPWSRPGRAAAAVAWPFRVNLIMLHLDPAPSTAGGSAAPSARRRPRSCARGSAGSPPPLPGQPCLLVSRSASSAWALGPRPRVASGAEPPVMPTRSSRVRHDERLLACGSPTCSPTRPVTGHRGGPAATSWLKGRFCWQLNRRSEWTGAYTTPVSGPGPVSGQRETAPGRARQTCELGRRLLSEPPRDRPLCLLVRKWTRRARAPSGSG